MSFSRLGTKGWKQIKIIETEREIKKNTSVTTLGKLPKEFKVSFEIKPTKCLINQWTNIIHFTVGKNVGSYGTRTPAVFFDRNKLGRLLFFSAVSGVTNVGYGVKSADVYKVGEWIHVEISQLHQLLGYNYTIAINGKQEHTVINNQPEAFYNVTCYVSNPWYYNQKGYIRKLFVYVKE